jgi:solute carrier family 35 (UDP-galactose transporter), member B1
MHAFCSLTYLGAMLASNEALQHVSYPTQVLGKSIKPVPVMILGVLIARKQYRLIKYIGVLMIVIGTVLFMQKDKKQTEADPLPNHPYALVGFGEALLLVSLALDGLTGAIQDKMNLSHKTNPHFMMYNMNVWSCLWLFLAVIVTGEIFEFLIFVQNYTYVIWLLLLLSILASIGQVRFLFILISNLFYK